MTTALDEITAETLSAVKKAQTTGITVGTGLVGFDLAPAARSLVPVETPFRNRLPRTKGTGAKFHEWRTLLNVTNQQPNPATKLGRAAPQVIFSEQDMQATYKVIGLAGLVERDAMLQGLGYDDVRARASIGTLHQLMIAEDKLDIGGQCFALETPGAPTVVKADSGGSIADATTVRVKCAARTGGNYFYGGGTVTSAAGTSAATAGGASKVTASVTAVRGAVAYDWYVSSDGATYRYYTTTVVNSVVVTSIPGADQAAPTGTLMDLSPTIRTHAQAQADSSANADEFNGLLATLAGDYSSDGVLVQHGTGGATVSGATFTSLDGAKLTGSDGAINEFDTFLLALYRAARLTPQAFMMNAAHAVDVSNKIVQGGAGVTYLQPADIASRTGLVGGVVVASYLNKAFMGQPVAIESHPSVPPGTIVARTDRVPYPNSNIGSPLSFRFLEDYADIPYAANRVPGQDSGGPREEFEIRTHGTFVNEAPVTMGVMSNIAQG
jgi:hypothetical protein